MMFTHLPLSRAGVLVLVTMLPLVAGKIARSAQPEGRRMEMVYRMPGAEREIQKTINDTQDEIVRLQQQLILLLDSGTTDRDNGAKITAQALGTELAAKMTELERLKQALVDARDQAAQRAGEAEVARLNEALAASRAQAEELSKQLAAMERERETPAPDAELRIFRLKFLEAQEAAMTITEIIGAQGVRTSADHRANALIVSAPPQQIEVIGALLENLDVESNNAAEAPASAEPRSLLVRVFWLADNLPEGEGQDPARYLPSSVLKAVEGVGLESPRIVSQVVNSAVNVMGDGQSPPFLTSTSVLVGGRSTKETCSGTLRVAGDREVVLQLSVQVENSCQVEGNLTMPIGHYMVLGTANTVLGPTRTVGGRGGRGGGGRGGIGGGPVGEGGFGELEPGAVSQTSRFAFVVQVVEAESFAPEAAK